jgi:hypothetical protein
VKDHRLEVRGPGVQHLARLLGDDPASRVPAKHPGIKLGRYLAGFGFMIVGGLVVGGVTYLLTAPDVP